MQVLQETLKKSAEGGLYYIAPIVMELVLSFTVTNMVSKFSVTMDMVSSTIALKLTFT